MEIEGGDVVGQFPPIDAAPGEDWGLLFEKDNPLVECVNYALLRLRDSGELDDDHDDVDGGGHRGAGHRPRVSASPPRRRRGSLTVSTRARRQQYERRQRRTGAAIARRVTTVVVVGLIVWLVPKTSGWQEVRESFFDWRRSSARRFRRSCAAFGLDLRIFLVCAPCIVVVALLVAVARNVRARRCSRCGSSRRSTPTSSAACR